MEIYQAVGHEVPWIAFLAGPIFIVARAMLQRNGQRIRVSKPEILVCAWCLMGAVLHVPFEWFFGFSCIVGGIVLLALGRHRFALRGGTSLVQSSVLIACGCFFFYIGTLDGRLDLKAKQATFESMGQDKVMVARDHLVVEATSSRIPTWLMQRSRSWTSWSGSTLGPSFSGNTWFIGPSGLVSGDDLGRIVADWAGTRAIERSHGEHAHRSAPAVASSLVPRITLDPSRFSVRL